MSSTSQGELESNVMICPIKARGVATCYRDLRLENKLLRVEAVERSL